MFVAVLVESLLDPVFLILGGLLVLATLALMLVVRTLEIRYTGGKHRRATYIVLIIGLCSLVLVWGGVRLVHSTMPPASVQTVSHLTDGATPDLTSTDVATPLPYQAPTPFPTLTAPALDVLNTLCGAINRQDTTAILQHYAPSLQQKVLTNRTALPKGQQMKFLHCQLGDAADQLPVGILLLQTEDGNGYADGYERPYRFVMSLSEGAWKVTTIQFCMSDGCIPFVGRITQ
ncbi:hypothetical protein KSC_022200 [Ktedonobacter sp. SOSP1-52]|uniref:hypothetical protein n=1 Tax=Ktedonobacter sp. SOSP1-52 TaxID=2778366 RepID=UPI001915A0F7|nr:hypothetical protein [Ktedonobacter sp. SOSP1-52]GHO63328.1 hypothetical protein KSC_022200 [Ktedonobacter sp. SOSP1-52]